MTPPAGVDRGGHEDQLGVAVVAPAVEGPELDGPGGRAGTASSPVTCQPRSRRAMPIEPPIRPVPTIMARRTSRVAPPAVPVGSAPSVGEVIAEPLGAVEVDVVDLVPGPVGGDVQQDPDAVRHGAGDGELAGTDSGTAPNPIAGRRWPGTCETMSAVAVNRMLMMSSSTRPLRSRIRSQQGHDPLGDGLRGVRVDGGGAADGSDGGGHQPGMLLRPVGGPNRPRRAGRRVRARPCSPVGTAAAARLRTSSKVERPVAPGAERGVGQRARSGCGPAAPRGGRRPRTCAGSGGCAPRG